MSAENKGVVWVEGMGLQGEEFEGLALQSRG